MCVPLLWLHPPGDYLTVYERQLGGGFIAVVALNGPNRIAIVGKHGRDCLKDNRALRELAWHLR